MDLYIVMYRPLPENRYFPIAVYDTLEAADRYVAANTGIDPKRYYVDLIKYIKE